MCLFTLQEKPKIAEHDIHVFKILEGNKTPYRKKRVYFLFRRAFMRSKLKFNLRVVDICTYYTIFVGIHTFNSQLTAEVDLTALEDEKRCCNIHSAIIPKGSKYAIGLDNDIASNKLIIFKTEKDYNAYLAKHKQKIINL